MLIVRGVKATKKVLREEDDPEDARLAGLVLRKAEKIVTGGGGGTDPQTNDTPSPPQR